MGWGFHLRERRFCRSLLQLHFIINLSVRQPITSPRVAHMKFAFGEPVRCNTGLVLQRRNYGSNSPEASYWAPLCIQLALCGAVDI